MIKTTLPECRKEKNVSQTELADAIGVSRQTIHSIETTKYTPSVELALKISEFFGLKVEDLFKLETSKKRGWK